MGAANTSPDGRFIATPSVNEAANARVLLLIPTAGGEPRELMSIPSGVAAADLPARNQGDWLGVACWAPDGRSVLVWRQHGPYDDPKNFLEGWQVPIDGGSPHKIENFPASYGPVSVRADGRMAFTLLADKTPATADIWTLESFLPSSASAKK